MGTWVDANGWPFDFETESEESLCSLRLERSYNSRKTRQTWLRVADVSKKFEKLFVRYESSLCGCFVELFHGKSRNNIRISILISLWY